MSKSVVDHILICGSGLAFEAGLAALATNLDSSVRITALDLRPDEDFDAFYGSVTAPSTFEGLDLLGIDEAGLLLETDSSFCYGSFYSNWAGQLNWTQSYQLPFPVWDGIEFHFYLSHLKAALEPLLVSAVCGQAGRFAHPPADANIPLSRAEYGYQVNPRSLAALLARKAFPPNVTRVSGEIGTVRVEGGAIQSIALTDGTILDAQFFIDATGPSGTLLEALGIGFQAQRKVGFVEALQQTGTLGSALRVVEGKPFGWQSQTHLRGQTLSLALHHPDQADEVDPSLTDHPDATSGQLELGAREKAWQANCAGIGHATCIMEPLTPAPLMLLFRDLQRLLQLVPITNDMTIEAREFNRLFRDDIEHCGIFGRALYEVDTPPSTPFWREATAQNLPEKLQRKLDQFNSRGLLVAYDLEPFNKEDWTILHYGMTRQPERIHPLLDGIDMQAIQRRLETMSQSIQQLSVRVPPHERYLGNYTQYLEKNHAR